MRRLAALALTILTGTLFADSPALMILQQLIPSPAPVGARDPRFSSSSGNVALTWREAALQNSPMLMRSHWLPHTNRWSEPAPDPTDLAAPHATPIEPLGAAATIPFPDASTLTAFYPERAGRIGDLHTQRHAPGMPPQTARALSEDSWSINTTPPLEPPLLVARDAHVLAVWLNHQTGTPRLFAAASSNAGEHFFTPLRVDDDHPIGRPSAVLLKDGSAYLTWIESRDAASSGVLLLRRISPAGDLSVPVQIATASSIAALGHPQLALAKDYDDSPAQLLIAQPLVNGGVSQIVTRLITLPPLKTFAEGRPCLTCPPDDATGSGYSLQGSVQELIPETQSIAVLHEVIAGLFPKRTTIFRADPAVIKTLRPATRILARIELRDRDWWLVDVRVLSAPRSP